PDRLAVRGHEVGADANGVERRLAGRRERLAEQRVHLGQLVDPAADWVEQRVDAAAHRFVVRRLPVAEHAEPQLVADFDDLDDRGVDAVDRGAGHQTEDDHLLTSPPGAGPPNAPRPARERISLDKGSYGSLL